MALPSLPTTFFNKASGKAINKTLDESCIPFPSPAALRRIRSSDSLVAASEFSVTTTWSVESSFHEVTRPDWAGETFVDQVTPDTQVEWQLSEECTRQLADTMHTPMPKGEELAPLHDAEPQRTSNPDESGSLRQSQAPFATRSTILTHPRLDRSKFYLTPPTEDSQEPESPVILRLRGGAGPASPENNDTDSCANIDELAEQWDPFHVKTDPKRGRFSKLFGKTSSTPKADKRPSKFGLGVRMPGISVVPALKLFSKGGNQAGSHGEDPPQGQTRSKHQRRNSANPAKIEFFFDQEEERKGPYMTRSSSAPSKLESLEDMHRLNASLQELSLRGGYLEGQSHEGSQPESECGSDFTAVDESEPFEYLQDSDPPLTLRGGGGDGNFHADEDEETWEVEEHQAPLPKVQPTARAQSAKEREQVSDFRDKVVRTAQPAYNPKTPEAQREASFLTSKDLMHIRDHILSSSTTQDRSTKQERDIQGFAGLAKPHILNEVGLTHMDIECSGQHNWPTTFDFANFATTLPSLKDANTASMSTNQGRRYRHEGLPISDPPVGDQVTGMHDDSTHSQSLQIPPSQQDDSETLNDDEGNMQAKHDWETQPDDAVELSDDDEDWSSKSSQEAEEYEPASHPLQLANARGDEEDDLQQRATVARSRPRRSTAYWPAFSRELTEPTAALEEPETEAPPRPPSPPRLDSEEYDEPNDADNEFSAEENWESTEEDASSAVSASDEGAVEYYNSFHSSWAPPGEPTPAQRILVNRALDPVRRRKRLPLRKDIVIQTARSEQDVDEDKEF